MCTGSIGQTTVRLSVTLNFMDVGVNSTHWRAPTHTHCNLNLQGRLYIKIKAQIYPDVFQCYASRLKLIPFKADFHTFYTKSKWYQCGLRNAKMDSLRSRWGKWPFIINEPLRYVIDDIFVLYTVVRVFKVFDCHLAFNWVTGMRTSWFLFTLLRLD